MVTDDQTLARYRFTSEVDLPETFTALDIEYLDVSATRVIVIYTRAVLNIEIADGQLNNARTLEIEVLDYPPKAGGDNPTNLITRIIKRISDITESDYQQLL
ncbi:hypothetical protein EL22_25150 [Halostagnicola sp. A56]|uniref:hypothetical protein n=1 Tax=Halostagnicola sp. A56 TaxID=1495067 RepID=UPI00049F15FA|nr:hypothetical protein [Halostagnicola sp. A56]KDE55350.1 hypothetical protein EL22_25150 [Halostagnicola sp. A56]